MLLYEALERIKAMEQGIRERDIRIKELETRLTSKNSSLPPSKDIAKGSNNFSTRKSSGKKSGGQQGHKGNNLKFTSKPDETIKYPVRTCQQCGTDLITLEQNESDRQQIVDIPQVSNFTTEHIQYSVVCPCCHTKNKSEFPFKPAKSKVQYGDQVTNLVTYLNVRHCMPMARLQELLNVQYGLKISQGTINNILLTKSTEMDQVYFQIKQSIQQARVVGADETGIRIEGQLHWIWAYQSETHTLFCSSPSRGFKTVEQLFPKGFTKSVLVSDRWAAQLKTKAREHQICLQHLKRDCLKFIETYNSQWARQLMKVLDEIIGLSHLKKIPQSEKDKLEEKLYLILSRPLSKANKKLQKFKDNLGNIRRFITTCLYNRYVPATNNGTEQAVRKVKIKEKISGGFRSFDGASAYTTIASIIDSAIKQGLHPFEAINKPEMVLFIAE